jgi:multiple sugar transport system permease protein
MRKAGLADRALRLLGIAVALLWSGFPIFLIVASSFKPGTEIFAVPPELVFHPTFQHYVRLWQQWPGYFHDLANSLIITIGATLLTAVTASAAGYVYSRCRSGILSGSAFFMLFVRMLPPIIVTLPLFPVVNWLGLSDTHIVLIVIYASFFVSLATWIMKAFIDQIPVELEEAAIVDGASLGQTLRRVVLPLAAHGLVAASIFVLVYSWNEFVFALVFTTRDAKTTPLVISEMLGSVEGVDWGTLFAASTVQLAPIVLFVIAAQRYLMAGLSAGAVKG